jgi:hypothetical protein
MLAFPLFAAITLIVPAGCQTMRVSDHQRGPKGWDSSPTPDAAGGANQRRELVKAFAPVGSRSLPGRCAANVPSHETNHVQQGLRCLQAVQRTVNLC